MLNSYRNSFNLGINQRRQKDFESFRNIAESYVDRVPAAIAPQLEFTNKHENFAKCGKFSNFFSLLVHFLIETAGKIKNETLSVAFLLISFG